VRAVGEGAGGVLQERQAPGLSDSLLEGRVILEDSLSLFCSLEGYLGVKDAYQELLFGLVILAVPHGLGISGRWQSGAKQRGW
jgi:hypothetical protein